MKRFGIVGIFLFVSLILHANDHPMLAINKQWNYMHVHISYIENPPVEEYKYSFSTTISDTITINGKIYYVIDDLRTSNAGQVYLREDMATQRVWILNDNAAEEQLLFDFNVAVGDTLRNITYFTYENPMLDLRHAEYVVTNVGFLEGRKTITLHAFVPYNKDFNPEAVCYEQYFTWIEGVGEQQWGLSATHFEDGSTGGMYMDNTSLLCVQQEGELLYASDRGKEYGCEIETSLHDAYSDEIACTYVNGQYAVCIPGKEKMLSMLLFDSQGKQFLPANYTKSLLPTGLLPNVYLLIVKTDQRCYRTKIIIR